MKSRDMSMSSAKKQKARRRRRGTSLPNVVGAITAVLILAIGLLPALASVRMSSKNGACLANLMQIGYANTIYASQDPADMALPVHRMQFSQCFSSPFGGSCGSPIYVGAYEWGGKSGVGRTDNVMFPGSTNPLNSKYGTRAGFGPNTRPLNTILYPQEFPDFGGLRPGPDGLVFVQPDGDSGPLSDTKLDLPLNRCPADTGFTGIHCRDFEQRGLTSYDHFGTSYNANLFMVSSFGPLFSNSPYLHRMSDILSPSTTLAYQENNGRFAWAADPDPCPFVISGVPGPVRGWHGKEWTFNAAFIDGHADTIYMRGYRCEPLSTDAEACGGGFQCIIIRGEGWQIDTLPLPPVRTQLLSGGGGRPSFEGCVVGGTSGRATSSVSSSSSTTCQTGGEPGCAAR